MSAGLRCPNPSCTHVFAPELLRPPARLTCPRCAYTFDIRPATAPVAPVALPVPTPVTASPLDFTSQAGQSVVNDPGLRSTRRTPGQRTAILVGVGVGVVGVVLLLVFVVGKLLRGGGKTWEEMTPFNFKMDQIPAAWQIEEEMRSELGCKWTWSRGDPSCLCGLDVEDHEAGYPDQEALLAGFTKRISKYLKEVEWNPEPPSSRANFMKLRKLGGQPAYVIQFEGKRHSTPYLGECFIMEARGFVYWFITLSPFPVNDQERHRLREIWNDMRNSLRLLNKREGWMPR